MIEIKNLVKNYPNAELYNGFSLSLEEGKITCILGESGCGKTTLLNCIAGLTGYIGDIPRLKCSYIFQTPRLVPNLTVRENLALVCKEADKVEKMLSEVRLTDKAKEYPLKLSGGQAQRVAFARALLFDGDIILMDEPFSSLDLKLKKEMTELYSKVQKSLALTALFVTHDVDEALSLSDRIIVIKDGKIIYDTNNGEKSREELISVLIGA